MAIRNYIKFSALTEADDGGYELNVEQLVGLNKRYDFDSPRDAIANDMFKALELLIDVGYSSEHLRRLLNKSGTYSLMLSSETSLVNHIEIVVDNKHRVYYYDLFGSMSGRYMYEVEQIEDVYLGYMVSEHIIAPTPKCPLMTRCYHEYFLDLYDAITYQKAMMKDYTLGKGSAASGFRIFAVDVEKLKKSEWYVRNLKIYDMIKQYKLDWVDYRCIENFDDIEEAIRADAYDDLDDSERASINRELCDKLYKFLSDEYQEYVGDDYESADDEDIEGITDDIILFALLSADSEETFNEVHKTLGPYEYRVGALTDSLYNDHRGKGHILMCSDGNMRWYGNCYAMNEWDGARGNPYFGKFQPNGTDGLICLNTYRPDLIVDVFPQAHELEKYQKAYSEEKSAIRKLHKEMSMESDDDYDVVLCTGDWYPEGTDSDVCISETIFPAFYESYVFSEEQCRELLSGNELVITDYKSKMGKITTIRGILREPISFDDVFKATFTRTDINARNRKVMNASLGITEGGIPDIE